MTKTLLLLVGIAAAGIWSIVHPDTGLKNPQPENSTGASDGNNNTGKPAGRPESPETRASQTTTNTAAHEPLPGQPPVGLDQPPDGSEPIETARWWAATYIAYAGANPPTELAARLAAHSTPDLQAQLASAPTAASYDQPLAIQAVTARRADTAGPPTVWVSVETPESLAVYNMTLSFESGRWKVHQANRL